VRREKRGCSEKQREYIFIFYQVSDFKPQNSISLLPFLSLSVLPLLSYFPSPEMAAGSGATVVSGETHPKQKLFTPKPLFFHAGLESKLGIPRKLTHATRSEKWVPVETSLSPPFAVF
jgi:hypothetical protein